jgi:hypothetical protein
MCNLSPSPLKNWTKPEAVFPHPGAAQLPVSFALCAADTVALVDVYANVALLGFSFRRYSGSTESCFHVT